MKAVMSICVSLDVKYYSINHIDKKYLFSIYKGDVGSVKDTERNMSA